MRRIFIWVNFLSDEVSSLAAVQPSFSASPPVSPQFSSDAVCFTGMCSSRGICRGNGNQSNRSSSGENVSSGAHYALCALGVGLIALGVVMIVWTVIPMDGEATAGSKPQPGNSTTGSEDGGGDEEESDHTKSSSVAMVLIGVGAAMLLLSICLGVRSKRMARNRRSQAVATSVPFTDQVSRDPEEWAATLFIFIFLVQRLVENINLNI